MLQLQLPSTSLALGGIVALSATTLCFFSRPKRLIAPGPPSYPLIGSLLSWPIVQPWLTFSKWRAIYGDIIFTQVFGHKFVIINSPDIATALLDGHGAVCSDRPSLYFANDLVGWKDSPIFYPQSHPSFKKGRQMISQTVGSRGIGNWCGLLEHESHRFLRRIMEEPQKLEYYGRKLAGTIILRILYGYDVKPGNDEYVDLIEQVNHDINLATLPGNFLVDFIPALQYVPRRMPGTGWMDTMDQMRARLEEVLTKPINFVEEQLNSQSAYPSFVQSVLLGPEPDRRHLAWVAEAMYTGGADTSLSAILTFFLCMTLYPDAQKRAQQELDKVIGCDNLPKWTDRRRLPYVMAIVKEVLRFGPIIPMAVPHTASQDLTFKGYFIPKGAAIIANVWEFTHDPSIYPNPDAFIPERYLGRSPQRNPFDFVFGFGRRACPGSYLAEAELFLTFSGVLSTMAISKKIGSDGQPITPDVKYIGLQGVRPAPFECDIRPRSRRSEELVVSTEDVPYLSSD